MSINYHPNRDNLKVGQQVILNTEDEFDGQTVTITAIKSYGFEIAEDGQGSNSKGLFEFTELNGWNMTVEDFRNQVDGVESTPKTWRDDPATKGEASDLVDRLQPSCHYCGGRATSFGFFDEPVCPECGG
jgi:hypothetical protein